MYYVNLLCNSKLSSDEVGKISIESESGIHLNWNKNNFFLCKIFHSGYQGNFFNCGLYIYLGNTFFSFVLFVLLLLIHSRMNKTKNK